MTENLTILGSTGSIGTQALDVARKCGFKIKALTANSRIDVLEEQIREFKPEIVAVVDEKSATDLKQRVKDTNVKILSGNQGVCECAEYKNADTVLNSIVGMAGLEPTLKAIEAKKTIALANKETLVAGGSLVTECAKKNNVSILPVDSEHSAIFQCLQGKPSNKALKKVILTASGGPFFGKKKEELKDISVEQALKHPNWSMGAKITIDSATMMNKGLELIEAVWLFGVTPEKVDIVVHRESVVHSLVEYDDNSVIAQLGVPDMRIPIQYALTYPERFESPVKELSLADYGKLTFSYPDYDTFECINICRSAITKGGLYPACANSANEQANLLFRQGKIGFLDIARLVRETVDSFKGDKDYTLNDVLETDLYAREFVLSHIK
ncbi:MAG: 1-deoxy-D-xylulose-5-phosphate reductoisomerase [Clostridiales bacterium]|nr:1-deoxy-D-xylulose-5-phosphate reductoisomerase [Clostridiales bacterium]